MGIDALAFSKEFPKKRFGRAKGRAALRSIDTTSRDWAERNGIKPLYYSVMEADNTLAVSIYPVGDDVYFEISKRGVAVSFRSSNAGPGYHSAVIDLLDFLEHKLQLKWSWGASEGLSSDETGYVFKRDFQSLQWEFAVFLRSLMQAVDELEIDQGAVAIPGGLGQEEGKLSGPCGQMEFEVVSIITNSSDDELLSFAQKFFPWWNEGLDAPFTETSLTALMWQEAQWRMPVTEFESYISRCILFLAEKLKQSNSTIPASLAEALSDWNEAVETDTPPTKIGIGYRRRSVWLTPFSNWQVTLPGHFYYYTESEDDTATYYHGGIAFRISSITVDKGTEMAFEWPSNMQSGIEGRAAKTRWIKQAPETDEDGSISQFSMVAFDKGKVAHILMLTMTVEHVDQLDHLDTWLSDITYQDSSPERISSGN